MSSSSWGLYKPGQGYWVRVLTAAAIAIITFATAGWLMSQVSVFATKLPVRTWEAEIDNLAAGSTPAVGQRVAIVKIPASAAAKPEPLGTVQVKRYDAASSSVTLGDFEPAAPDSAVRDAERFEPVAGGAGGFKASAKNVRDVPLISTFYLQGGAAVLVLLVGALLAAYFCGIRKGSVEFLIATDMEMKKVSWSTRKDIWNSTLVVVGASFLIAATLFLIDIVFQQFFKAINVLQ